jgi:hypothetical protein
MNVRTRIEKLERRVPADAPVLPAVFFEFCEESGTKKLVRVGSGFPPASQGNVRYAQQQGRRVMILKFAPGTELRLPR